MGDSLALLRKAPGMGWVLAAGLASLDLRLSFTRPAPQACGKAVFHRKRQFHLNVILHTKKVSCRFKLP